MARSTVTSVIHSKRRNKPKTFSMAFYPKRCMSSFPSFSLSLSNAIFLAQIYSRQSRVCLDDTPIQVLHKMSCKDRLGGRDLRSSGHVREVLSLNPSAASFSHLFVEKMSEDGLQHTHLPIKIKFLYRFIIR